jgi:hypothetical protein
MGSGNPVDDGSGPLLQKGTVVTTSRDNRSAMMLTVCVIGEA